MNFHFPQISFDTLVHLLDVFTCLGVWALVGRGWKRGKKVTKAIAHAPELLHGHAETGEAVLTAKGIRPLFQDASQRAGD